MIEYFYQWGKITMVLNIPQGVNRIGRSLKNSWLTVFGLWPRNDTPAPTPPPIPKKWGDAPVQKTINNINVNIENKPTIRILNEGKKTTVINEVKKVYTTNVDNRKTVVININLAGSTPSDLPPRRLPKEGDGQTETKTPKKKSISVQQALHDSDWGSLLHQPISRRKVKMREVTIDALHNKIKEQQNNAIAKMAVWLADAQNETLSRQEQELLDNLRIWDTSALICPEKLRGWQGEIGLVYGTESLFTLAEAYAKESLNAFCEVTGIIPLEYEILDFDEKVPHSFKFSDNYDKLQNTSLSKISTSLGTEEYPIKVPKSLNAPPPKNELEAENLVMDIKNLPHFISWQTQILDEILGSYPIKIHLADTDLIKVGEQGKEISLPNIAETLAELTGMSIYHQSMNDLLVNVCFRILNEAGNTRVLTNKAYFLIDSVRDYLGYKTKHKTVDFPVSYNANAQMENASFSDLLKEIILKTDVEEIDPKETTLERRMLHLEEMYRIIKAVHWRKFGDGDLGKWVDRFKALSAEMGTDEKAKSSFDEWISKVEAGFTGEVGITDTTNPYGKPYEQRPKIREVGNSNSGGN